MYESSDPSDPRFLRQQQHMITMSIIINKMKRMEAAVAPMITVILSSCPKMFKLPLIVDQRIILYWELLRVLKVSIETIFTSCSINEVTWIIKSKGNF